MVSLMVPGNIGSSHAHHANVPQVRRKALRRRERAPRARCEHLEQSRCGSDRRHRREGGSFPSPRRRTLRGVDLSGMRLRGALRPNGRSRRPRCAHRACGEASRRGPCRRRERTRGRPLSVRLRSHVGPRFRGAAQADAASQIGDCASAPPRQGGDGREPLAQLRNRPLGRSRCAAATGRCRWRLWGRRRWRGLAGHGGGRAARLVRSRCGRWDRSKSSGEQGREGRRCADRGPRAHDVLAAQRATDGGRRGVQGWSHATSGGARARSSRGRRVTDRALHAGQRRRSRPVRRSSRCCHAMAASGLQAGTWS